MKCNSCKRFFTRDNHSLAPSTLVDQYGNLFHKNIVVCPYCDSADVTEAVPCVLCRMPMKPEQYDNFYYGVCKDCGEKRRAKETQKRQNLFTELFSRNRYRGKD